MRWVDSLIRLLLSPGALLACAALLALPFVVAHLAGWREYTGILSGTLASAGLAAEVQALLGLGYAAAFMVATILAPVFALAAGVVWVLKMALPSLRAVWQMGTQHETRNTRQAA